jgi:hypothetical protein
MRSTPYDPEDRGDSSSGEPAAFELDDDAASSFAGLVDLVNPALEEDDESVDSAENRVPRSRNVTTDPAFGYLIAMAMAIGTVPLIQNGDAELRYTLAWGVLAVFSVLAWLFGRTARIGQEAPENIIWGISFGLILGMPLLAFGGSTLASAQQQFFGMMTTGSLLAYLLFVMPLAESLFFRGVMHENRPFWMIGLMSSLWSVVLFIPFIDLQRFPIPALVIFTMFVMINLMYGYVRERNGLAAAWVCQIVINLSILFIPSVI